MNSTEQIEFEGVETDEPVQVRVAIQVMTLEEIMESEVWTDAATSVEAFIQMVEEHGGSKSGGLAKDLLMSAIFGSGEFPLSRISCFDSKNIGHMLKILEGVGTYSADFRSGMVRKYGARIQVAMRA